MGPVYHIPYDSCDESYIDETERLLKAQFLEQRRPNSTTSEVARHIHIDNPEHQVDMDGVKILTVEPRWFERGVREVINIRMEQPSMNKDGSH